MRHLMSVLRRVVLARLSDAEGSRERLFAMVLGNFDDAFFSQETCSVWTQFWGYAPYNRRLERLQRMNRGRVRSNLDHELKQLMPPGRDGPVRLAIQAYMDGVWIHTAQVADAPTPAQARRDARAFLDLILQ